MRQRVNYGYDDEADSWAISASIADGEARAPSTSITRQDQNGALGAAASGSG